MQESVDLILFCSRVDDKRLRFTFSILKMQKKPIVESDDRFGTHKVRAASMRVQAGKFFMYHVYR